MVFSDTPEPPMAFGRVSCALLGVLAFNFTAILAATAPVVDLGYAKYSGTFNETTKTTQFLGIRFAAPPTGKPLAIHDCLSTV